jgi:hypothetical protein
MRTWSLAFLTACGVVMLGVADDATLQSLARLVLISVLAVALLVGAQRVGRTMAGYERLLSRASVTPLRSRTRAPVLRRRRRG